MKTETKAGTETKIGAGFLIDLTDRLTNGLTDWAIGTNRLMTENLLSDWQTGR